MQIYRLIIPLLASLAGIFAGGVRAEQTAEPLFPMPEALAPAVAFWTRIYTEVDSASGFIHDSRRLDVVYATLYLNPAAPPDAQDRVIEKAFRDYREALILLASGQRHGLSPIEQRALRAWGEGVSADELTAAAENLRFQRGQADRFQQGLARSSRWKAKIESILERIGVPRELAALPHVESSYNPNAVSKAGAAGLWQLMPATARRYLRVDETADERFDIVKSSEAAAHLLRQDYSVLKSWPLAVTAYNHGLSGVRRAVRETGTSDLGDIAARYETERFRFASRNFYASFLAALEVASHPGRYFRERQRDAHDHLTVVTPAYLPADVIVEGFSIEKERLRALNPSLHHAVWNGGRFIPEGYALRIPASFAAPWAEHRMAQLARHFGFAAQKPSPYYDVRLGDSLSQIALQFETDVPSLLAMNGLGSADEIHAGQILRVPMGPGPEPLGTGSAAIWAIERAEGAGDGGASITLDLSRLIASLADREGDAENAFGGQALQAEPMSGACRAAERPEPEDLTGFSLADLPPDLAADPFDYGIARDGTIEIQIAETLGHYAQWLQLSSERLRKLNELGDDASLIVGRRLKLDLSNTTTGDFEARRTAYHAARQLRYFRRHRITGVLEHAVAPGDNLWLLAVEQYRIPLWLLRQYNPDVNVDTILPLGGTIFVPFVEAAPARPDCAFAELDTDTKDKALGASAQSLPLRQ